MNTTCLTLILVSMLVANATASLAFPRQAPAEWNPINDGIIIDCRPHASNIEINAMVDESGLWMVNVEAPECHVVDFDISNRRVQEYQQVKLYPHQFPSLFKNVSVLFLIPASQMMVAAWI